MENKINRINIKSRPKLRKNENEIQTRDFEVICTRDRRFKLAKKLFQRIFKEKSHERALNNSRVKASVEIIERDFTDQEQ